jgi:tRNA threonylcarbamoyladenosine biosynthesis protein TsaE
MNQIPVTQTVIYSINQHCRQETDTAQLAKWLAQGLSQFLQQDPKGHLNISLEGDLGAGKTTFARYLIQGMGYVGKVKSPTYTLCEPYSVTIDEQESDRTITAHHFDLYRMRDPLEWQEAGFAEHFDTPGFCLIEWPEKAEGSLPNFDIQIQLTAGQEENERSIILNALSAIGASALKQSHDQ